MYTFRFFRVVPPVPSLMVGTFTVVTVLSAAALAIDPGRGAGAIAPVLVLQMFAAATGLAMAARRGHYDLLLTSGESRLRVALGHWAASALPGALSLLAVGLFELVVSRGARSSALSSGSCAAMVMVSTVPWALSVALPRFSAAVGWLLVVVAAVTLLEPHGTPGSVPEVTGLTGAAAFLIYPLVIAGRDLTAGEWLVILPGLATALGLMSAACWWITRADFPLETAQ